MGFGGPVWHASVAHASRGRCKKAALRALEGVGSTLLGEWHDDRPRAYHIRRRLTPQEADKVGPVLDLRGTSEAEMRANKTLSAYIYSPHKSVIANAIREELAQPVNEREI